MLQITIVGWYGTETLGDRAILAGLFSLFHETGEEFSIRLGSLYPFFSEQTVLEDEAFYRQCSGQSDLNLSLFDSTRRKELDAAIRKSDLVVIGGGPLMGIGGLFMLEYAFAKARKLRKKTMILGCGVGPIHNRIYEKSLCNIVSLSDLTIFRDEVSRISYCRLSRKPYPVEEAIDPAVFAVQEFQKKWSGTNSSEQIVVCLRDFLVVEKTAASQNINIALSELVRNLTETINKPLRLLPMHYFSVGGDDRYFLNRIVQEIGSSEITVENEPQTLVQTFQTFAEAFACVGMRFHSVVLQTILNGNNIILDYVDPKRGKIVGFLQQIGGEEFYRAHMCHLKTAVRLTLPSFPPEPFHYNTALTDSYRKQYVRRISETILN